MLVQLEGLENPIDFGDAGALVAVLETVLRGWRMQTVTKAAKPPRIRLSIGPQGYERRSPWIETGTVMALHDPVDAVCDLLLDIERAFVEDAPARGDRPLSLLHAAAVEMGAKNGADDVPGLVIFPSTHATGKSLLSVALAQAGHRVFADDQLPVISGPDTKAIAPGFLPRLRRPLPGGLDDALATFVRSHAGAQSGRFRYVDLAPEQLAPLGTQARVKGVVLLERTDGAQPAVTPVSEPQVLKACVLQSYGRRQNALEVLDTLHAMVQGAQCVKLTYADAGQAVALLEETFA